MISGSEAPMYTHKLVQISPNMWRKCEACHWWPWTGDGVAERSWLGRYYCYKSLPDMKFKWSVTVETDKAWGTMPLFGIYLRLQPLAEGGFLSFLFQFPNFILPGLHLWRWSPWLVQIKRQTLKFMLCYTPLKMFIKLRKLVIMTVFSWNTYNLLQLKYHWYNN